MKNNKKAFTLIELLVVIAIIGLLSTLSIIALNTARAKARDAKRLSDVRQIQTALAMYYDEANDYPSSVSAGGSIAYNGTTYLASVPTAPSVTDGDCTSAQNAYTYTHGTGTYTLTFCLGSQVNDLTAGVHTASPSGIQ